MKRCLFVVICLLLLPNLSWSLTTTMELGVRGGVDATGVAENYAAGELYLLRELPWQAEPTPGVRVYVRLDAGAGYLHGTAADGGWLALGGDLVLSLLEGACEVEAGFRPTWMIVDEFGQDDYGGPVHFSSHAGVALRLGDVSLSYRFQHLSNAHLYEKNPGLNLHLVGLGMQF